MDLDQLTKAQAAIDEIVADFQDVEKTEIPEKIIAAAANNWELHLDAIQMQGARLAYLTADRKQDAKRLIRFGEARQLLQELEEALIESVVLDEADILFGILKGKIAAFQWVAGNWRNLDEVWKKLTETWDETWRFAKYGLPVVIGHLTLSLALPAFYHVAAKAFATRDRFPDLLRKKALPQRNVTRRYRRKVSRL